MKVSAVNRKHLTLKTRLYPELRRTVQELQLSFHQIPDTRKIELRKLSQYIDKQNPNLIHLNFICTHNSRRSHLGMIWAAVAARVYNVPGVKTFSGGTEATAFNPRAVRALRTVGFRIPEARGENPNYLVAFGPDVAPLECFSKKYDHPANPTNSFAAIMTCSHADENCPFIPGASLRLPLTYEDPKLADGRPEESARYLERTHQIGRELLYAFSAPKRWAAVD